MEPPNSLEPGFFTTGNDSPVRSDSSTSEDPKTHSPSAGILDPGGNTTVSFFWSRSMTISRCDEPKSVGSSKIRQFGGVSERSLDSAVEVFPLALDSIHFPRLTKTKSMADVSNKT
ncbi:hypothetical protein OGAPHI_005770 [Ogataea philodendri]|uniref:Uncharacterized protein n=1 Tax=Ogataea philodendri TaxID=1378263 RepID=A0A9P8NZ09_9ASCO|nr:uncharacterized protein OGAPHI_005770 [Ogataea philodendri]KAH3662518.1 hypothetical protein OGAPHI_005770 [Ogataea philodendri]